MRSLIIVITAAGTLLLGGCGDSGPEGPPATQLSLSTTGSLSGGSVTWKNLCKRITIRFKDDTGAPHRYGRTESLGVTLTNAAAYGSNTCDGDSISTLTVGPESKEAIFWINSTTLGEITIEVSGPLSGTMTLTTELPTADLVLGQPDFTTGTANTGGVVTGETMKSPFSIERCAGRLLVADTENNRVLVWNTTPTENGESADFAIGQPNLTSFNTACTQTGLSRPQGTACADGRLYVADFGNSRILGYNITPSANGAAADFAWGQSNFTTCPGQGVSSTTDITSGLAVFGSQLVATNPTWHRVLVWNIAPNGAGVGASTVVGQTGFSNQGASTGADRLNEPQTSRLREGYLLVADAGNHRVLIYDTSTLVNGAPALRVVGQPGPNTAVPGDGASELNFPSSVDFDGDHLIVADTGNARILIWNGMPEFDGAPADVVIGAGGFVAGSGAVSAITGVYRQFTLDGQYMWVSDYNHRVLRFPAP